MPKIIFYSQCAIQKSYLYLQIVRFIRNVTAEFQEKCLRFQNVLSSQTSPEVLILSIGPWSVKISVVLAKTIPLLKSNKPQNRLKSAQACNQCTWRPLYLYAHT